MLLPFAGWQIMASLSVFHDLLIPLIMQVMLGIDHWRYRFHEGVNTGSSSYEDGLGGVFDFSDLLSFNRRSVWAFHPTYLQGLILCILCWYGSVNAETQADWIGRCSWFGFECYFTKVNKPIQINHSFEKFVQILFFPVFIGRGG